ncbi:MAG: aminotransferase class I/II-fold pyridoxal phosphate-dependent enzyme [SAR324 cluster bacterium]|nr:aminotransferase class I/II-fold pyridoxal phosphate-dependent enzyme [SAR324 cluster bacterium]
MSGNIRADWRERRQAAGKTMKVKDAVARMGTYDPPLAARKDQDALLLDFNESTLPPAPEVIEALQRFLQDGKLQRYPSHPALLERLAEYAQVRTGQLILCNGSDQSLEIIIRAVLEPGDEMVQARPGFAMIPQFAEVLGAVVVSPAYGEDMSFPCEEVLAAVTPRTRLIVLINPNNPTGTAIAPRQIETILKTHPDIPVLVDEAYYEFTGETAVPMLARHGNLAITRTFSKAFALAGLRLGYVISNEQFIQELYKVRGPFDVNIMAVKAAEAVLAHSGSWRKYIDEVMTRAKPMVERFFDEHSVTYFRGAANFMLVRPDDRDAACEYLRENRILVRPQSPPIGDTFRLSVGTVADMTRFMEVYSGYLASREGGARQA